MHAGKDCIGFTTSSTRCTIECAQSSMGVCDMSDLPTDHEALYKPREVDIPASCETFDAQRMVITQPRTDAYSKRLPAAKALSKGILDESRSVIASGKFKVELVMPPMMPG